jgi:hypothetical protein
MAAMTVVQASENILDLLRDTGETMGPAEISRRLAAQGRLGEGNHNTQRGRAVTACALLVKQGVVVAVPLEGGGNHYKAAPMRPMTRTLRPVQAAPARVEPVRAEPVRAVAPPPAPEPYRAPVPVARAVETRPEPREPRIIESRPEPRPELARPTPAEAAASMSPRTERKLVPVYTGHKPDPHGLPPQSGLF